MNFFPLLLIIILHLLRFEKQAGKETEKKQNKQIKR